MVKWWSRRRSVMSRSVVCRTEIRSGASNGLMGVCCGVPSDPGGLTVGLGGKSPFPSLLSGRCGGVVVPGGVKEKSHVICLRSQL